jgi:hypothetical protein
MKLIENISESEYIKLTKKLAENVNSFSISIIGWEDGDYFKELCEEDGGLIEEHFEFFSSKPLGKNIKSLKTLIDEIIKFQRFPYLSSVNGNYQYNWDLHIWIKNNLTIYNAELKLVEIYNLNFLERIIGIGKTPTWLKARTYNNV